MDHYCKLPVGYTDANPLCFSFTWQIKSFYDINKKIVIRSNKFYDSYHECCWYLGIRSVHERVREDDKLFEGWWVRLTIYLERMVGVQNNFVTRKRKYFQFSILDVKSTELYSKRISYHFHGQNKFYFPFIEQYKLHKFTDNGDFTIRCDITTAQKQDFIRDNTFQLNTDKDALGVCSNFETLRVENLFTDVTFVIGNHKVEAHKLLLALRSEKFLTKFHCMPVKEKCIITIEDFSKETIEEMIHFIYTGELTNIEKVSSELLSCANEYKIIQLKEICEKFISSQLSADNIVDNLLLAHLHSCETLKKKISCFIASNKKAVIDTPKFEELLQTHPDLVNEVLSEVYYTLYSEN